MITIEQIRQQIKRYKCTLYTQKHTLVTPHNDPLMYTFDGDLGATMRRNGSGHPTHQQRLISQNHRDPLSDESIRISSLPKHNITTKSNQMTEESIMPSWKPPPFHGLRNSSRIIPEYYTSTNLKNGILNINYYDMIIDDIRNLRPLSHYQMKYIRKNLTHTEYYNIIYEYNQVMQVYLETYLLSL
jgi:hypothetical protein